MIRRRGAASHVVAASKMAPRRASRPLCHPYMSILMTFLLLVQYWSRPHRRRQLCRPTIRI